VIKRTPAEVLKLVKDEGVEIIDVRFCDLPGMTQHFSVPAHELSEDRFTEGFGFDGSSIRGFQEIQESDMILLPDPNMAYLDPFRQHKTLNIHCFVHDPVTLEPYSRDPRHIARKAEAYLLSTGIADTAYFGPEAEFFIFDHVEYGQGVNYGGYRIDSIEGHWNTTDSEYPNLGYKMRPQEGYFPVPPNDKFQDLRSEMILALERLNIEMEVQHHEVATAGQAEMDMRFDTMALMADKLAVYKYVVKNVAVGAGYTATFMPKPLFQENGSGMHCHQSLWKDGEPLFFGDGYGGLSDIGRWYVGGLLKHARSILGFAATRPRSTSSTRCGTVPPRVGSRCTPRAPRPSGSSSAAPTHRATRTSPSRRCCWPASTVFRTRSSRRLRWTRTSSTCRPRNLRSSPTPRVRWKRRWRRSRPITITSGWAASSPTT
jgi:glutamine synthetase